MKIKKHVMGPLQSNCYLVWAEGSSECLVIDPGARTGKLAQSAEARSLKIAAIVQTHGHWDHSAGTNALQRRTGAALHRHPEEPKSGLLHRARKSDGHQVFDLVDGQGLAVGGLSFQVLHTPGHSRGSICLFGEGALFCGDLLFKGGVGRFDLSGGSFRELVKSLNERLSSLPDETVVYPGHGPATVLGEERRANPFFKNARELAESLGR